MAKFHRATVQDGVEQVNEATMEGFFELPELQPTEGDLNIEEISDIQSDEKVLSRQVSTYIPPILKPSSVYKKSTYTPNKLNFFLSKSTFKSIVIPQMRVVELTLEYDPSHTFQTKMLSIFPPEEIEYIRSHKEMNFLHFGAIQVTIGSLVPENIRPVCYLALCDRRQVEYNHACLISSLSRMTKKIVSSLLP